MLLKQPTNGLQVGEWTVDPAADEISRHGAVARLEPRMMRLLVCLAQSSGQVVSTQQLLDEIWAGVIVSQASVYQAVSQLRKLLGDTGPEPTYISTVPRKGYRLIAPVRWIVPDPPPQTVAVVSGAVALPGVGHGGTATFRNWPIVLAVIVLFAGITALAAFGLPRGFWYSSVDAPSIAVLPFVDMTPDQSDQPFSDGLSEELSTWLSQIPTLRVVARTSAFAFRDRNEDVRTIGKTLSATHVLEGSVRRSEGQMRITAQLIDARDGYHVWARSFDLPFTDIIRIQEEIARAVAAALEIQLSGETAKRFVARKASSVDAYEHFLLARHHAREFSPDANTRAIEHFESAIALDAKFAPAYAGLAEARLNEYRIRLRPLNEVAEQVEMLIATALRADPGLSEAYVTRAGLRAEQYRLEESQQDLIQAVRLNPNNAEAYGNLGRVLGYSGNPREALENLSHAIDLDPLGFNLHVRRCVAFLDVGRFKDAEGECGHASELQPTSFFGPYATSWNWMMQGRLDQAIYWNERAQSLAPELMELYQERAGLYLDLGLSAKARETYERALQVSPDDWNVKLILADVVFAEGGEAALKVHLANLKIDTTDAITLLRLADRNLIVGNQDAARKLVERVLGAPDFNLRQLADPWKVRFATADAITVAQVALHARDDGAARLRLAELETVLDNMERNGQVGYGIPALRAQLLAVRGDLDGAMRSLQVAVDSGWRNAWWGRRQLGLSALWGRQDFQALMSRVDQLNSELAAGL